MAVFAYDPSLAKNWAEGVVNYERNIQANL